MELERPRRHRTALAARFALPWRLAAPHRAEGCGVIMWTEPTNGLPPPGTRRVSGQAPTCARFQVSRLLIYSEPILLLAPQLSGGDAASSKMSHPHGLKRRQRLRRRQQQQHLALAC